MTVVNINLKNVGSSTSSIDSVTFYSPVYRDGATTSELVSTAEENVPLVDGIATVDLIPGPVRVHFKVRGIADTVAKDGIVPDSGPVSLNAVLQGSLNYTPGIINEAVEAINTALDDALGEVAGAVNYALDDRVTPIEEALTEQLFWESPPGSGLYEIGFEDTLTPRHDGLILYDTFSRVEAELVGSTPDVGAPWSGSSGGWSSDGSVARSSGVSGSISTDASEKNIKLETRLHVTADSGIAQVIRLYLGATTQTAGNGYMASVNIANTGFLAISPYTTLEGVSTRIGDQITGFGLGFPTGGSAIVDLVIEIDALNVKTTATGPNGIPVESTGFLTEAQYGLLGTWAVLRSATDNTDGFAFDSIKVTTAPYPH